MENVDLEIWWSSLPVTEKERIARKGLAKAGDPDQSKACYPACTAWWNTLEAERKEYIYNHCVAAHGDELHEWKEQNPYGD
ncbi:MAG: hypothetical protein E7109_01855 [Bacteroidales bacterium]|jgi:hypothetical protein|nr:hypothetical protein [Bacteroidales bacterium]